jgi:hypothetical protein
VIIEYLRPGVRRALRWLSSRCFEPGHVYDVTFQHDADCATVVTGSLADCSCAPDVLIVERPSGAPGPGTGERTGETADANSPLLQGFHHGQGPEPA